MKDRTNLIPITYEYMETPSFRLNGIKQKTIIMKS